MEVAEYYNEFSDAYVKEYGSIFQAALFAVEPQEHCRVMMGRGMIYPGHSVLDVGCGVGGVMVGLKANGVKDVTGVTNSKRQVELSELSLELSDFMEWKDEGRRFDRVIICESFGYFPEPSRFVEKVVGLLKPGGMVYVKDLCAVSDPDLMQQAGLMELRKLWNYENYTVGEMSWFWGTAGLRRIGGDDNLWRFIRPFSPEDRLKVAEVDCGKFMRFISGNSELGKRHFPTVGQVPLKAADFLFTI
jgi:SAM-dependent methyltransferase